MNPSEFNALLAKYGEAQRESSKSQAKFDFDTLLELTNEVNAAYRELYNQVNGDTADGELLGTYNIGPAIGEVKRLYFYSDDEPTFEHKCPYCGHINTVEQDTMYYGSLYTGHMCSECEEDIEPPFKLEWKAELKVYKVEKK